MKILVICLLSIGLFGCQQMQQEAMQKKIAAANQRMVAEEKACTEGEELTRANALERRDCVDDAIRKRYYETKYPFMWIIEQNISANRESALEYSEGRISKEKYKTAVKKHGAEGMQAEAQARAEARQEQMQRNMQLLQAWQGMQPAPAPMAQPYMMPTYSPPPVTNTNCYGYGNNINCTSYR